MKRLVFGIMAAACWTMTVPHAAAQLNDFDTELNRLFGHSRSEGFITENCRKLHFFYNGGEVIVRCDRTGKIKTLGAWGDPKHLKLGAAYLELLDDMSNALAENTNANVAVDVVLIPEQSLTIAKIGYISLDGSTNRKAVYINPKYVISDFTLAHELAHWALGHNPSGATKAQELEADYWGGYIYGLKLFWNTGLSGLPYNRPRNLKDSIYGIAALEPSKDYNSRLKRLEEALKGCQKAKGNAVYYSSC